MYRPPRGPRASKFVHPWIGPLRIVEPAGYDNYVVEREDKDGGGELFLAHVSFLVIYHFPTSLLKKTAIDIEAQLAQEDEVERTLDDETSGTSTRATVAPVQTTMAAGARKRDQGAMVREGAGHEPRGLLVELRRRRRRNQAGQYVLEYLLRPLRDARCSGTKTGSDERWFSTSEYDQLFHDDRVVEDSGIEEGV